MSTVPERITRARSSRGFAPAEVASALGMSLPSYYDLESYDDEWETVAELRQLAVLAEELNVRLFTLIGEEEESVAPISFEELAASIERSLASKKLKKEDLSWEIDEFIETPTIAEKYPIMFFQDLGPEVGFDWRAPILSYVSRRKAAQPGATDNPGDAQ